MLSHKNIKSILSLLLFSFCLVATESAAQRHAGNDTIDENSKELAEAYMLFQQQQFDSLRRVQLLSDLQSGSPVKPFYDTLFLIHSRIASYTPADRASSIAKHIMKVYDDPFFNPDSLSLVEASDGTEITYNSDFVVMLVTNIDAMYYSKESNRLASEYLEIIKKAISRNATKIVSQIYCCASGK
jgi:hypothetical protein